MGTLTGTLGARKVREQEKEMGRRERGRGGVKRFIIVYLTYTILTAMIHRIAQWGLEGL